MSQHTETSVKQHEPASIQCIALRRQSDRVVEDVEIESKRGVSEHRASVRYCKSGKETVSGREHLASCQYDDVEDVSNYSEHTHGQCNQTMAVYIPRVESTDGLWSGISKLTAILCHWLLLQNGFVKTCHHFCVCLVSESDSNFSFSLSLVI